MAKRKHKKPVKYCHCGNVKLFTMDKICVYCGGLKRPKKS